LSISRPIEVAELICCSDGTEADAVAVEHIDHPRKTGQRARQPVDLVDDHDVDLAHLDVSHQAAQCGPLHIAARETAIARNHR
jgi:hypothetical protein